MLPRAADPGGPRLSGIGLRVAERILSDYPEAHVILGSRDAARGEKAAETLKESVPGCAGRLSVLSLDVTSDASVSAAQQSLRDQYGGSGEPVLYGLVNNAGVGFGRSVPETLATNLYGAKRCSEAFAELIQKPGGRIVNMGSASGPNFVSGLGAEQKALFTSRATTWDELDAVLQRYAASPDYDGVAYGLSKAALAVLTMQLAAKHPDLRVNACSPGYVLTDLTAGMGASKTPAQSNCHVAPLFLLFGQPEGNGRYYGSDALRSPLDRYRNPGDPPYVADD